MAKVARSEFERILIGPNVYEFTDGTRQVTEAEAEELLKHHAQGGPKVTIENDKPARKEKS